MYYRVEMKLKAPECEDSIVDLFPLLTETVVKAGVVIEQVIITKESGAPRS